MSLLRAKLSSHIVAIVLACALVPALANMGAEESASVTEPNFVLGKKALEAKEYAMILSSFR